MTVEQMIIEMKVYVKVNASAHIHLRGKACIVLLDHLSDVASALERFEEDLDGYSGDVRDLYNELLRAQ